MGFAATPGANIDDQVINSMGFTGDVINQKKPNDSMRILLLGGSVMFNRHMSDKLKPKLQEIFPQKKIELVNASLRSHTTASSALKIKLLKEYQFDYVFIYHGINDLWVNHAAEENYQEDYSHFNSWYKRGWLLNNSTIARSAFNFFSLLKPHVDRQYIFPKKEFMNRCDYCSTVSFANNINTIITTANAYHSKVLLITFAFNIPKNYSRNEFLENKLGYINPDNYNKTDVFNWGTPAYVTTGITKHNDIIRSIAKQQNTMLWDADKALSDHIEWFGDVCHFNDEGVDQFIHGLTVFLKQHKTDHP